MDKTGLQNVVFTVQKFCTVYGMDDLSMGARAPQSDSDQGNAQDGV